MSIILAASLEQSPRGTAAALIVEAFGTFYDTLRLDQSVLREALAEELIETGTELEFAKALIIGDNLYGIMAAYPASQMADRQKTGMFHLLSALSANNADLLLDASAAHAASVHAVPGGSYYLARLAVAEEQRGRGAADVLMQEFRADATGRPLSLHVHRSNARAISFYSRHGFEFTADDRSVYRCMTSR